MKKLYTLLPVLTCLFSQVAFSQVLMFSFSGANGSEATWPSSTEATGVQQSAISRGSGVIAADNADRFNSKGWATAATLDLNDYLEFTITPASGYSVTLSEITLQHQRSNTGPKSFVVRTSIDGYTANATNEVTIADVNTNQSSTFSFPSALSFSAPVTIRIYAYNAEQANGTWGPGESMDGNDITVTGLTVLPVNFFGLKAVRRNNTVEIDWSNATEENVEYYGVEKSTDGQHFSELTRQSSQKNSGGAASYVATDRKPSNGANFYRIRAVELNGNERLSNVLRVDGSERSAGLNLYPNPVRNGGQFTVQLNGVANGSYQLVLYNMAGAAVKQLNINVSGSSFSQTIQTGNLPKGSYLLQLNGKEVINQRLVIQ